MSLFFFFFKQKTAYEMRISDWSSDVCSSDLQVRLPSDDGLEVERLTGVVEDVGLLRRGTQAAARPEVEDVGDVADEDQQVTGLEHLVGAHRAEVTVVAHDVGQVHAGQAAQPGVGDGGADEDAVGLDLEVEGEIGRGRHRGEGGVGAVGKEPRADRKSTRLNSSH